VLGGPLPQGSAHAGQADRRAVGLQVVVVE
jgi:hypothetical protein